MTKPIVGIVIGSDSDLKVMQDASKVLTELGIESETIISSAHRVPEKTAQYARSAEERGIEVIIAGAGMAAHLPGVIASLTTLPVIGVPIQSGAMAGADALYAIVQMPPGIPVASMAINGAKNAGIFAAQILSTKYPEFRDRVKQYRLKLEQDVEAKSAKLAELGVEGYLNK